MWAWQAHGVPKRSRTSKDASSTAGANEGPFNAALSGLAALKADLDDGAADESPADSSEPEASPPEASPAYVLKGKLAVHKEKKGRSGKTATRISGLRLEPAGLSALAKDMKRQLGCGAVIEDGDVVLLGDLPQRAADWLRAHGAKRVVGA